MITIRQYFTNPTTGHVKEHSPTELDHAEDLLARVNALVDQAVAAGAYTRHNNPNTGTEISGSKGGAGDGGFRAKDSTTGAPGSSHRQARAVDVADIGDMLDEWLDGFEGADGANEKLAEHDLYREHAFFTPGWTHLTTRAPGSGRRTFRP